MVLFRLKQGRLQLLFVCLWADWFRQELQYAWVWGEQGSGPTGLRINIQPHCSQPAEEQTVRSYGKHDRNLQLESAGSTVTG